MGLEFQRPFSIDPNAVTPGERSLDRLNQTFGNIGQQALQYRQQQIENQRQAMMMQFQKADSLRRGADIRQQLGYDPGVGEQPPTFDLSGPQPSGGSMPMGTTGPQPNATMDNGMPGYSAPGSMAPRPVSSYPQMADAGTPDAGSPQQGPDLTSHFNAWNGQGRPAQYYHPDLGGQPQGNQPQSAMDLFNTMRRIPGAANQKLFLSAQDEARKQAEEQAKYGTGANGLYSTYDQAATQLAPFDAAKRAQIKAQLQQVYPGGSVPKSAISTMGGGIRLDVTQGEHERQFGDKRLTALGDALDPSKQRAGAFGVSKQVYDRAERLETLASAFKDGNLDSRQIEELAIGLNAMLSGANTGAQQQVKSLVPDTVWGNAQKFKEWFVNQPQGTQQQAFVQRMLGSITREKATASDQIKRTQFQRIGRYADLEKSNPDGFYNTLQSAGVDPQEYGAWKKGGYKPMTAVQSPEGGAGGGQPMTAVNRKTGQRIQSSDGGKTWTVAQ